MYLHTHVCSVDDETRAALDESRFGKWRQHSLAARKALGIPIGDVPLWTGKDFVQLHGLNSLSHRVVDLLDAAWCVRLLDTRFQAGIDEMRVDWYVDLSQAIQRRPWGALGTFTSGYRVARAVQ